MGSWSRIEGMAGARVGRVAYRAALVAAAAGSLVFTGAQISSSDSLRRERNVDAASVTQRMFSADWKVPDRNIQEAALRGTSAVSPLDVLVIGTVVALPHPCCFLAFPASPIHA